MTRLMLPADRRFRHVGCPCNRAGGSMFYIVAAATIGIGFIYFKKRRERKGTAR